MKILVITLLVLLSIDAFGQSYDWNLILGGTGNDQILATAFDSNDNVYVVGKFSNTVDFDPNTFSTQNETSNGESDGFIAKFDSSRNLIWYKKIGGSTTDVCNAIDIDNQGNVIVAGYFSGTVDLDPNFGNASFTPNGYYDAFIIKLDSFGNTIWVKTLNASIKKLKTDNADNIYYSGVYQGTCDFNLQAGIYNLVSNGMDDIFVSKIDQNATMIWSVGFGGTQSEGFGNAFELDAQNNIYMSGYFFQTVDFNPGAGISSLTAWGTSNDAFVLKLNNDGSFVFVKRITGPNSENVTCLALDSKKNIFISGVHFGSVDFDPDPIGNVTLNHQGNGDAYLLKLDSLGTFKWVKSFAVSSNSENVFSILTDEFDILYLCGIYGSSVDFDPGPNTFNLPSSGAISAFILKLNNQGHFLSAGSLIGSSSSNTINIVIDQSRNLYCLGDFEGNLDVDPSVSSNQTMTSSGLFDGVLVKLNQCVSASYNTQSACDSITWIDGETYYSSTNGLVYIVLDSQGCDSIVNLNLSVFQTPLPSTDSIVACDQFTWINGQTYTASIFGLTYNLYSIHGCDSIITLNLTILNSSDSIFTEQACGSYTWPWNGQTYTSSGLYHDTIPNAAGCDSIITLNLTVTPSQPIVVNSTFSLPSDPNNCLGELAIDIAGNGGFDLSIDNGAQQLTSTGYSLVQNVCPGVHDLHITDYCGDTLLTQFVIPVDSNYVFNNPFIDSIAVDSLGTTVTNCTIYYNSIDTAYIDSIWATGNTVSVIWNIVDSNGSNFDTASYVLNNGNGVYWLQISVFCPTKALGDYFTVTQAINFENGGAYLVGMEDELEQMLVEVYPNPTIDGFTVNFNYNEKVTYKLIDGLGKQLLLGEIFPGDSIGMENYETGIYFLELRIEGVIQHKQIIKI